MELDETLEINKDKETLVLEYYDTLRSIYGDVLQGYSFYEPKSLYVKHFSDRDHALISRRKTNFMEKMKAMKVPTRAERLKQIIDDGEWSQDDEDEIVSQEYFISDHVSILKTQMPESQKRMLQKRLSIAQEKIIELKQKKVDLVGTCCESKSEKMANNYYVYHALHLDEDCKERLWPDDEDFNELEDHEMVEYIIAYNRALSTFSERNFRRLTCLPFVLNMASYCKDQGMFFYGKPITEFTNYQLTLYAKASRNTFVLRESKGEPPPVNNELTMYDLMVWYDESYSIALAPEDQKAGMRTQQTQAGSQTKITVGGGRWG